MIALPVVLILPVAGAVLFLIYGAGSASVQRWIAGQLGPVAGVKRNGQPSEPFYACRADQKE
jgi:hypothetical protein